MGNNLLGVRQWAVQLTGRNDLVDDSYNDNGMDKYINEAQISLDMQLFEGGYWGRYLVNLAANDDTVLIENLLAVKLVRVIDPDDSSRDPVERQELEYLLSLMSSSVSADKPKYYAHNTIYTSTQQIGDDLSGFDGATDIQDGTDLTLRGLLLYPHADQAYTLQVWGKFRSKTLSSNTDTSIWTTNRPYLLTLRTAQRLEESLGNMAGARAYEEAAQRIIREEQIAQSMFEVEDQSTLVQG